MYCDICVGDVTETKRYALAKIEVKFDGIVLVTDATLCGVCLERYERSNKAFDMKLYVYSKD